jgi:hypothetical protein
MGTTPLERLAGAVIAAALDVGYDIQPGKRTGDKQRLAHDADVDPGQLSRLISAQRMPGAETLAAICHVIKLDPMQLLAKIKTESGTQAAETRTQGDHKAVLSRALTPDEVADSWGITDPVGREEVRSMHLRHVRPTPGADTRHEDGQAQAD